MSATRVEAEWSDFSLFPWPCAEGWEQWPLNNRVPCSRAICQLLKQRSNSATQCCQLPHVLINYVILALNQSARQDYRGKSTLKNSIIVFPMTTSGSFTFIITFYWTALHKPGARAGVFTGDDPARESGRQDYFSSTDNLGPSLNTQICFTFTALLYGSAADICKAESKTISLENYYVATVSQRVRDSSSLWGTLEDQVFHNALWCDDSLNCPSPYKIY